MFCYVHPLDFLSDLISGTVTLPVPSPNLCLKAIALGRGTQNYTCATSDASSVPSSIGAVATLFDASPLLPFLSPIDGQEILDLLPEYLLTFPSAALQSSNLPMLGQHFFTAPTSPIFNLMPGNIGFLEGAKVGDIIAPAGSPPGPYGKGNGAVDWLALSAKPGSVDIQQGYRVFTAGGKAPATCAGQQPTIEVQYAAQYWFYG